MNSSKRAMILTTGIVSIVGGAICAILLAYYASVAESLASAFGASGAASTLIIICVAEALLGVVMIVLGALLCQNPVKNGVVRTQTGKLVALISVSAAFLVCSLLLISSIIIIICTIAALVLAIIALCLKTQPVAIAQPPVDSNNQQQQ